MSVNPFLPFSSLARVSPEPNTRHLCIKRVAKRKVSQRMYYGRDHYHKSTLLYVHIIPAITACSCINPRHKCTLLYVHIHVYTTAACTCIKTN